MRHIVLAGCFAALLLGCGTRRAFVPAEPIRTTALPSGYQAATYDLVVGSRHLGEATVFSRGAYDDAVGGEQRTVVHVGFVVDNDTSTPLGLDIESLHLAAGESIIDFDAGPWRQTTWELPANDSREMHVFFTLPTPVDPEDVKSYQIGWRVHGPGIERAIITPFRPAAVPET